MGTDKTTVSKPSIRWYHCRSRTLLAVGILVFIIVGASIARRWHEHRIVTHLESLGAGVMLKADGYSYVGISSVEDVSTFFKEACRDLQYLARNGYLDLNLSGSNFSDADLEQLAAISGPFSVDLRHTKITEEGVKKLRQVLPNCKIVH